MTDRVAVIGARGHTGAELLSLLAAHPRLELAHVGSRALAGKRVADVFPALETDDLRFEAIDAERATSLRADAIVLALPNDLSSPFVTAIDPGAVIVDLSADHRFDDSWAYGLPERCREQLRTTRRIANPGCYATAAQLALDPLTELLTAPPRIFGISGYSGAGTTPSPRNDPEALADNIMPYALTGHVHEREISHQLGHQVHFMPHVAPFFRGISLTIDCVLRQTMSGQALRQLFEQRYDGEPLVRIVDTVPLVRDAVGQHHVSIGGFSCNGPRAVLVATIDNLLKGAATQAAQNLNLSLGHDELLGIPQ